MHPLIEVHWKMTRVFQLATLHLFAQVATGYAEQNQMRQTRLQSSTLRYMCETKHVSIGVYCLHVCPHDHLHVRWLTQ